MTITVAINGYGCIGRNILRPHYEGGRKHDLAIVAVNDLGDAGIDAHLTRDDTAHGGFPGTVAVDGESLVVNATASGCCPSATRRSCRGRHWVPTWCSQAQGGCCRS
jgi:glyceraldehyde-3-phosphate dehydrogenase/erythrose-4-phosphate dehydrogenase